MYAGQIFDQNDFICAYFGELMSCEEGERRGQLAESQGASYLYNLSETQEIDAQFCGSLMKYANNTFEDMTNSESRVLFVGGRKHICLFAT